MKRYTVKQVIKMEERHKYLYQVDRSGDAKFYFMPLMLLTSIGACYLMHAEATQIVPLIIGAATSIFGTGSLAHLFSAGFRSDLLYDKLNKIYDVMGEDFKKQVEEEMFKTIDLDEYLRELKQKLEEKDI